MPELPEVETTRRGIAPHLIGREIVAVHVREPRLRWPVPEDLAERLVGSVVRAVERRGKYLLVRLPEGSLIVHLGMSGSLRIVPPGVALRRHDHVALRLDSGLEMRLHDPRRFGAMLWAEGDGLGHPLLAALGPEPLGEAFTAAYLHAKSRGREVAIKPFLMDSHVVVGVGNIYANEALFMAGIYPARAAGRISVHRYARLVESVRAVLAAAIEQGGTTLRDFVREDGSPGYFSLKLAVYDREGQPCPRCGGPIRKRTLGQRSSFYCPRCQRG